MREIATNKKMITGMMPDGKYINDEDELLVTGYKKNVSTLEYDLKNAETLINDCLAYESKTQEPDHSIRTAFLVREIGECSRRLSLPGANTEHFSKQFNYLIKEYTRLKNL
jgi:hypothetical protein